MKKYYREGTYDNCDAHQRLLELCMRLRYKEVNGHGHDRAAHEMRTEMLQLSTKTERPDHVWKFKPLPAAGEIEGGGEGESVGKGKKDGRAVGQDTGYWFRGGARSASG